MPRIFITSGTSYTLPADFNPANNTVECYGGGGSGNTTGTGGGGGAYASVVNISIGASATVQIQIGSAGATDTWFNATSLANAVSNGVGISCGAQGGSGPSHGLASSSCGTVKYDGGGGNAAGGGSNGGGGGGGAAGPNGAGANGGVGGASGGGGGGGSNGGYVSAAGPGGAYGGWGGANRLNTGQGTPGQFPAGTYPNNGGVGTAGAGGGGGAKSTTGANAYGGWGGLDNVYGDGVHGPGGGGGGGGATGGGFFNVGGGSNGYGGGAGGSNGAAATSGTGGLIVITYVSAPVGGSGGGVSTTTPTLSLRAPYFVQTRTLRQSDPLLVKIDWLKQPADLLQRPPGKILYQSIPTIPAPAPNATPLYKPPWLQWPELLRHPVAGLDYRQQFLGKKPLDLSGIIREGPDTVSTGPTPIQVYSSVNASLLEYDIVTSIVHPVPDLGGSDDIIRRVKLLLPKGWWNFAAPIRDAIIGGLADSAAWCYGLISYAKLQSRVAWATGIWLDIISKDYFGFNLLRRVNESDANFRGRIQEELIRERVTRAGMAKALEDLTGNTPVIFEPWNTGDAGAWDVGTFAWDIYGGWGDTILPAQAFINIVPPGSGIPGAPGWDIASGWDTGGTMWGDMNLIAGTVTDADIYATINKTRPTGSIMWTQLSAPQGPIPIPPAPVLTPTFAPPVMKPLVVQPSPQMYSIASTDLPSIGLL